MALDNTHDHIVDRLSDYMDGELDPRAASEVEEHLATCSDCRTVATELHAVAARASSLADRPPQHDLWLGIAARIGNRTVIANFKDRARGGSRSRCPNLRRPSMALMVLSGGMVWLARSGRYPRGLPGSHRRRASRRRTPIGRTSLR